MHAPSHRLGIATSGATPSADEQAARYRAWKAPKIRKRRSLKIAQRITQAIESLAEYSPKRVLEVGCGHGILISEFFRRFPGASLIGIDRSRSMIQAALQRNPMALSSEQLELFETDLEAYVHQGALMDAIVTVNYGPLGAPEERANAVAPAVSCLKRSGVWIDIFDSPISESVNRHMMHALRIFREAGLSPRVHSLSTQRVEIHALPLQVPGQLAR